ncbi:MAG TPA: hypothetical protein VGR63_02500 [Casimicrobiaceae bacterium]|jgi:hypothetical protein|nr:hypothetical protein [Casimicrobiaceae bacterium]
MATSYQAWIEDHAYHYEREQAALARTAAARAIARDIADLRAAYTVFVQQFASAAERDAVEAGFAALQAADPIGDSSAYEDAVASLDQLIDAIDRRADAERAALLALPGAIANPVALAVDGWLNAQRAAFAAAA